MTKHSEHHYKWIYKEVEELRDKLTDYNKTLGNTVQLLRAAAKMPREVLGKILGVSISTLTRIEAGHGMDSSQMKIIEATFKVNHDQLSTGNIDYNEVTKRFEEKLEDPS